MANHYSITSSDQVVPSTHQLRIAICLPQVEWIQQANSRENQDAAFIQQGYIAAGLRGCGHSLTFITQHNLNHVIYTKDGVHFQTAPQTWSSSFFFELAGKTSWRMQQWLGIPYLNVFSNYRRYDGLSTCIPGHDIVYERNSLYNASVAMACKKNRIPYIIFFDADQLLEHDFMGTPITGILRRRAADILRYNLKIARCVICVSQAAKSQLITNWDMPREKIVVFPNGVDINKFRPDFNENALHVSSEGEYKTNIIFVGNFYRWHDVATLLAAFARVVSIYEDIKLILVGDGYGRQAMIDFAEELGIERAVSFAGLVPHESVPLLLAGADIAVVPVPTMDVELWLSPMKLFEYMASGKAIVASAVGQISEIIRDSENGLLVPPGDVFAMSDALEKLVSDADLRRRLGQQARKDAVKNHSWEQYITRLDYVFRAVIAGEPVNQQ